MKIAILHLSDIHISLYSEIISKRAIAIVNSIENLNIEKIPIIIAFSGDLVYNGLKEEYELAEKFLELLKSQLAIKGFTEIYLYIVPGNHDCNFTNEDDCDIRELAKESILRNYTNIKNAFIESCLKVQDSYFEFANKINNIKIESNEDKLFVNHKIVINKKNININLFNTSWLSEKNEIQSKLIFPCNFVKDIEGENELSISILHHPFNWLDADNVSRFKDKVEMNSDIILTGHEHKSNKYLKQNLEKEINNYYFEGGILYDKDDLQKSNYNFAVVDFDNSEFRMINFQLSNEIYIIGNDKVHQYQRNKYLIKKEFKISNYFYDYLNDVGISLSHKGKEKIRLNDLFVYPNFKTLKDDEEIEFEYINGKQLLGKKNILIIGDLNSGKTTYAKRIFKYNYDNGNIPILLNGESIKHTNANRIKKLIDKKIEEQYNESCVNNFYNLTKEKRILIIDDFQKASLNFKSKNLFIKNIKIYFDNIIVLSDSFVQLEVILSKTKKDLILSEFEHFRVMQFGNLQRKKLIELWLNLGYEEYMEEHILTDSILRIIELIDKILGRNMFPKYPCFILLVLQQIEWQIPIETNSVPYIFYYNSLITRAFENSKFKSLELDTKYTFLSYIAFEIFNSKYRKLNHNELKNLYEKYYERKLRSFNLDDIIIDFINTGIIEEHMGHYNFKYPYLYYYFVSKYFIDNLTKTELNLYEEIKKMIDSLQKEEFANIILFITYLTKDDKIINLLIEKGNNLLKDNDPCDFEKHTNFINSLINEVPKLIMEEKSTKEKIEEYLINKDEIENKLDLSDEIDNDDENKILESENQNGEMKKTFDYISKINESIKTVQILGQVIKNTPGSIDAEVKINVAECCFSLGMRALNGFIKMIEDDLDEIVLLIEEIIKNKEHGSVDFEKKDDEQKIKNLSKKIAFYIAEFISMGFVKTISNAVGSNKLSEVYEVILSKNPVTSYKIINISVEVDYSENFPEKNVCNLADALSKNYFAFELLKLIIADYLEFHDLNYKIKQNICNKLNISYKKVLLIEEKMKSLK